MVIEARKERFFGLKKDPPRVIEPGTRIMLREDMHDLYDYIIPPTDRVLLNVIDKDHVERVRTYSSGVGGRILLTGKDSHTVPLEKEEINKFRPKLATKRTITGSRTVYSWRP